MNHKKEYVARINKAIDYIEKNIDKKMTLEDVAKAASFSKFHFHRIFSAFVAESPNAFIQRIRIEKAASSLLMNPEKSITEIALDIGFASSSSFAKLFKNQIGMSASDWRIKKSNIGQSQSKIGQMISNERKNHFLDVSYIDSRKNGGTTLYSSILKRRQKMKLNVSVKEFDDMPVVYIRHIGPYQGDSELFGSLFGKLFKWAGPRGLLSNPEMKVLCVYHDNPEITESVKLRTSVCLTAPEDIAVTGEVGKMTVPGGKYAVAYFRINSNEYGDAWSSVYGEWLPESGYQPDERPSFEMCLNDPKRDPEGKHEINICVPVIPL